MKPSSHVFSIYAAAALAASLLSAPHVAYTQQAATNKDAATFENPVLWEDLADLDILRVGDAYYYSASNMHYSPGAPILRSYDLVHWEYIGHSIPVLDFSPAYDMNGGRAYVKGSWASFLNYRKSSQTWYWGGCIEFKHTFIYTAPKPEGPWTKSAEIPNCYYDAGMLVDDDDTMYVAYGNTTIHVAQLSPDGKSEVKSQVVFQTPPEVKTLEGSRFYKINGNYYIFNTRPANAEYVLRSKTGPFGPYEIRPLEIDAKSPVPGSGVPHQGGIVETAKGDWYYVAFIDAFPGGRVPVLAPLTWDADGWPHVTMTDNTWAATYPMPDIAGAAKHPIPSHTGTYSFKTMALSPEWEWNHNPDNTKWSAGHGLILQTATVTDDLYSARNTLTHRILGPSSSATIEMDLSKMKDGDRAGLAMLRDMSAWVGVAKDDGKYSVVMRQKIDMDRKWNTANKGEDAASAPITSKRIWLRVAADVHPGADRTAVFSYSTDGKKFTTLGPPYTLNNRWQFFMGYRYAIFNYATRELGGQVTVPSFTVATP
jgi:beta-xylosidase